MSADLKVTPMTIYDSIVIGSGQAGTPLAITLAKAGRKTLLIENKHIGGCCINEGCTPTKTMVASGRAAYIAKRGADYGVKADVKSMVDMVKVRQRKRDIVNSFRGGSENRLKGSGVEVLMGSAKFIQEKTLSIDLGDGKVQHCKAEEIFINVGERPAIPTLDGLEDVITKVPERVLDSTSIQELGEVPESLIVLGGGPVGIEFAQLFQRLGSQVHVVQKAKQLLPREDPELARNLQKILVEEGLQIHCSAEAMNISTNPLSSQPITLTIHSSLTTIDISTSHILLATGRRPNTDTLNLPSTGVTTDPKGYIISNQYLETNISGSWRLQSYDDFRILRDNLDLLPNPSRSPLDKAIKPHSMEARKSLVPYVVFTDPQLAHVGLHLQDIPPQERKNIQVAKMPMSYVARALETDEARGMMKAVVNGQTGEILGFSCLSLEGGELMSIVQACMMGGVKWWQMREAVWAHPTMAESLNNIWGFLEDV